MPIYEYRCDDCGHELEALQKISDAPLTRCPACAAEALKKKVSAAGFRLAGSGWYETDFKKDGRRNLAGDAGDKKAESGKTSDAAKTDKPAASSASKTTTAKTAAATT